MKFSIAILALATIILFSCGGDHNEPTEEEVFISKLTRTWKIAGGQVTLDGVDVTEEFTGLEVTFTADKHYTTVHGVPPIWPVSGTFSLQKTSANLYDIIREDSMQISIVAMDDKSLTLQFYYTAATARSGSISGKYEFKLNK